MYIAIKNNKCSLILNYYKIIYIIYIIYYDKNANFLLLVTNMKYMTIIPHNMVLVTSPYLLYF